MQAKMRDPSGFAMIVSTIVTAMAVMSLLAMTCGCVYKGGKVIDGTNLAVGISMPGTEWSVNVLDYVGGIRVAGQDRTIITVTNRVVESNEYFGVVKIRRQSELTAIIEPTETPEPVKRRTWFYTPNDANIELTADGSDATSVE